MSHFLFVYGTLMSAFKNHYAEFLKQSGRLIESGFISARLYNVGEYPAAVFDVDSKYSVTGEIWYISNFDTTISIFDEYEGINEIEPEYRRECIEVLTVEKNKINCWTYFYNFEITFLQEIETGDYLKWKIK